MELFKRNRSPRIPGNSALNKAESVRSRREKQSQKKRSQPAVKVSNTPSPLPPVLMRKGSYGVPLTRHSQTRPRLKLSFALNKLGTEIVMPAIPDIKPGWRILSGLLTLAFGMMITIAWTTPELNISQVEVSGLQRLTAGDIETTLQLTEQRIFMVSPAPLKEAIENAFPEFEDVKVEVKLPTRLLLNVTERQPVVAWQYNDMVVWIDREGIIFPPRGDPGTLLTIKAESAPPLMLLGTPDPAREVGEISDPTKDEASRLIRKQVNTDLLASAILLSQQIPPDTALVFNGRNGLGWRDGPGWDVFIGNDLTNLDQKLIVYQGIVDSLEKLGVIPRMISVEYVNAPYYRVE